MRPFDFSLVGAPFRMQPGLRRIAAGTPQLTPSRPGSRHLREKTAVLASFADEALVAVAGFDAFPVLSAIAEEAADMDPVAFVLDRSTGRPVWRAPLLGWSVGPDGPAGGGDAALGHALRSLPHALQPTALLCLAFEDDFAVIDGATATIPWLAVCLPSRWAPETKVGGHFAAVHAPVADNALLLAASDSLTKLVTGGERWERFVWTVSPEARLHQHPKRLGASWSDDDRPIDELSFFRSERQTFIPLPGTNQAVFSIHVETLPLADAVRDADAAARLHAAIASMSAEVLAYKGLGVVREPLLAWLGERAAGAAANDR